MQVVILAGGLGTRLRPLTDQIPKSLIAVRGRPFLQYQFQWLASYGLRNVLLCTGHLGDQIEKFAGDGGAFGIRLIYSREEMPLGTGGALKNAEMHLEESFCVLNGDSYLPINPLDAIRYFRERELMAMMLTMRNNDLYDRSNVMVEKGLVTVYDRSRPGVEFIDYGMRMFRKEVLQWIPSGSFCDLAVLYNGLIKERLLGAYVVTEPFYEIGSPGGLARFQEYVEREQLHRL